MDKDKEMPRISEVKVKAALNRLKNGKAFVPDDIPVEVWKCLGEENLTRLLKASWRMKRYNADGPLNEKP